MAQPNNTPTTSQQYCNVIVHCRMLHHHGLSLWSIGTERMEVVGTWVEDAIVVGLDLHKNVSSMPSPTH